MKVSIGVDNGITGTIGVITDEDTYFIKTPVKVEQSYTKAKQNITRVEVSEFKKFLEQFTGKGNNIHCIVERPMINPQRWKSSMSGMRALEATLNVIELLNIPYSYVDSKEWQKELLPRGCKKEELKVKSKDIAVRMFPQHKTLIEKHKDGDGILMAEYCRRKF